MRKFLLASVATLGTGGLTGAALAQSPPGPGTGTSIGTSTDIRADRRTDPGAAGLPGGAGADGLRQQQQQLPGAGPTGRAGQPYARARSSSTSTARCKWTAMGALDQR